MSRWLWSSTLGNPQRGHPQITQIPQILSGVGRAQNHPPEDAEVGPHERASGEDAKVAENGPHERTSAEAAGGHGEPDVTQNHPREGACVSLCNRESLHRELAAMFVRPYMTTRSGYRIGRDRTLAPSG